MNDFCARMVVDDLIQNALKEDVCSTTRRGAAGRRAEDRRSEVGGLRPCSRTEWQSGSSW